MIEDTLLEYSFGKIEIFDVRFPLSITIIFLDFANEEIPSPQAKAAPTIPPPTTQISACVAREEKCLIVRDFNIQWKKQKKMATMKRDDADD